MKFKKTLLGGFNRKSVLKAFEELDIEHQKEVNALNETITDLQNKVTMISMSLETMTVALKEKNDELEEQKKLNEELSKDKNLLQKLNGDLKACIKKLSPEKILREAESGDETTSEKVTGKFGSFIEIFKSILGK